MGIILTGWHGVCIIHHMMEQIDNITSDKPALTSLDVLYLSDSLFLARSFHQVLSGCDIATVSLKSMGNDFNFANDPASLILIWSPRCKQVQQADFLLELDKEIANKSDSPPSRDVLVLQMAKTQDHFLEYLNQNGAIIIDGTVPVLSSMIELIYSDRRSFRPKPVERQSLLGMQIALVCSQDGTHPPHWKENPEAFSHIIPWLPELCKRYE